MAMRFAAVMSGLMLVGLTLWSCGGDDDDDDGNDAVVASAAKAYCAIIFVCMDKPTASYTNEDKCNAALVKDVKNDALLVGQECADARVALLQCAGKLSRCDGFDDMIAGIKNEADSFPCSKEYSSWKTACGR